MKKFKTKKAFIKKYGEEAAAVVEVILRKQRADGFAYLTYATIGKLTELTVREVTRIVHHLRGGNVGDTNIIKTVIEEGRQQGYAVRPDVALCFTKANRGNVHEANKSRYAGFSRVV